MFKPEYPDKLNEEQIKKYELQILKEGPYKLLYECFRERRKVLVNLRNNYKFVGNLLYYDKHFNMVLYDVKVVYQRKCRGRSIQIRCLPTIVLRGDNVVVVVKA